ncbi:MAG: hypothetical protein ACTHMY_30710 [Solirubrobacteraceae bacterium]
MITLLYQRRTAPGRGSRVAFVGVMVALVAAVLAPAALASGWSLQTVPNEPFTTGNFLDGVSCSATNNCFAVGGEKSGGQPSFLVQHYNGSNWAVQTFAGPAGVTFSQLTGVSCPTNSFCMAVGSYSPAAGARVPLVFTFNGSSWQQQSVPLGSSSTTASLNDVSCWSNTFCMLVGQFDSAGLTAAWSWNGSSFTLRRTGGFFPADLTSVSCTSQTFCAAVGFTGVQFTRGIVDPFAIFYNGSSWSGPAVPIPNNSPNSLLTGVSCPTATDCQAVGQFAGSGEHTFGERYDGSSWTLQSTPPTGGTNAAFGNQGAASCAELYFCWAIGAYNLGTNQQLLGDFWNGSSWQFATLPNPGGPSPFLNAVSCATSNLCEAVGSYTDTSGQLEPLAEQYHVITIPPGCCRQFAPRHFALRISRLDKRGVTITAELKQPKVLELLVQRERTGRLIIVGLVPLGSHPAGTSHIHWSLRVDGKLLRQGRYEVSLRSVIGGILSPPTPPGEIALAVKANGHVSVG